MLGKIGGWFKKGLNWWNGRRPDGSPRPVVVDMPMNCPKCDRPHYNMEDSDFCRKEHP